LEKCLKHVEATRWRLTLLPARFGEGATVPQLNWDHVFYSVDLSIDFSDVFDEAREAQRQKRNPTPAIQMGTHTQSGAKLNLPFEDFCSTHTSILGSTRAGKTKFIEGILQPVIEHGYGLVVLDGKGELYDLLVDYCAYLDLKKQLGLAERTILIDPNEDFCVGINYLELMGERQRPSDLARLVLAALKKFFKEDSQTKFWLEEWGMAPILMVD